MVTRIVVGFFETNCYIYTERDVCLVVDPGGDPERIAAEVEASGCVFWGIALTHGHLDHTMAAGALIDIHDRGDSGPAAAGDPAAGASAHRAGPKVAVHRLDAKYLGESGIAESRKLLGALGLPADFGSELPLRHVLPEADILLQEGDRLFGTDLEVIETPGHTAGGCSFYSRSRGVLFSGDALFAAGIGRADLPDGDPDQLIRAIRTKLFSLPPETVVYPGHGPETTIGREMRGNPFLT